MSKLNGQVALVTGSSRGIGAAIAVAFAAQGASMALHGRDASALADVRARIGEQGGRTESFIADVTCFEEIEAMRREVEKSLGPVDILVANAGGNIAPPRPVEQIEEAAWNATIAGNLTATYLTIKSVLPGMKARGRGTIVTISSAAARRPHSHSPVAYAAAKAAVQMLTQDVAAQVGPFGIRANCIATETILTERNAERISPEQQRALVDTHPIRRLGTPEDVAQAALFLVSSDSSWITGITVDVAGGAVMA